MDRRSADAVLTNDDRYEKCGSYKRRASQTKPSGSPARRRDRHGFQTRADSGEERGRNFRVRGGVQTGIDGGEKRLLLRESLAAGSARGEMRAQSTLRQQATGGSFDQRVFKMFTWHRNFSANFFRATKMRDFTVPTGTSTMAAISSIV